MDFTQIALLFSVAAIFGIFAKFLNQPLFIGYLFAGIFLSTFRFISDTHFFEEFSHIGIALLLFLMGLEMNLKDITEVGKHSVVTAVVQMFATFVLGLLFSFLLNFPIVPSLYIALAATFSSTIIAVRLISEKKDLNSLYGRITVAILLIQDFVALVVLMFLSGISGESYTSYLLTFLKGGLVILSVWLLSRRVLPLLFEKIVKGSTELMFILSIAWALGISALLGSFAGFNLETGGFLAGLALSSLPEHLQIANKTKPLRDFFLTIFFLILGTNLVFDNNFIGLFPVALVLSIFVIVSHIIFVMFIMGAQGYKNRTSFLVGVTGAQVSEFALIIAAIGLSLGHINNYFLSLISLVAVITMVTSTYFINSADKLYLHLKHYLKIFERKLTQEHSFLENTKFKNHVILVGCDRAGRIISKYLVRKNIEFIVIDFNPKVFRELTAQNIPVIFGDVNDLDILELAKIEDSSLIISTISNLADNLSLIDLLKSLKVKPNTIFTSTSKNDGIKLYEKGATYVIVPEMVAGDYIKNLVDVYGTKGERIKKAGHKHFKRLVFV